MEAKSAGGFIRSTICSQKLLAFQCVSCMYVVTIVIVCCDYCGFTCNYHAPLNDMHACMLHSQYSIYNYVYHLAL